MAGKAARFQEFKAIVQAATGEPFRYDFAGLADAINGKSVTGTDAEHLRDFLLGQLTVIDRRSDGRDADKQLGRHLVLLGLGLLVGKLNRDVKKQRQLLNDTLFPLASGSMIGRQTFSLETRLASIFELNYVDQFVGADVRREVFNVLTSKVSDIDRRQYPPLLDYFFGWRTMEAFDGFLQALQHHDRKETPNIYVFSSIKGGVGKTSCALSLMHYLSNELRGEKCAVLDLDFSGPSLQFHLDVTKVSEATSLVRPRQIFENTYWTYPSFADLLYCNSAQDLALKARARYGGKFRTLRAGIVPLPDSPSICAQIAALWDNAQSVGDGGEDGLQRLFSAITAAFGQLAKKGYRHVIVDMRPGLYGSNGLVLRYISQHYPTRLFLVGTPRLADFATMMYESCWLTASIEFRWYGSVEYLLNMCNGSEHHKRNGDAADETSFRAEIHRCLGATANDCIAIAAKAGPNDPRASSATQIFSTRIWPYFYFRAGLPERASNTKAGTTYGPQKLELTPLPFDQDISRLQNFIPTDGLSPTHSTWGIDFDKLEKSPWYDQGLRPVFTRIFNR